MIPRVAKSPTKPIMVYDGECGFCGRWIERWRRRTGQAVEYRASQDSAIVAHFPEIPPAQFDEAVHLILPDGHVYRGAEAVLRGLDAARCRPGVLLLRWYARWRWFAAAMEAGYRLVARNRRWLSKWV